MRDAQKPDHISLSTLVNRLKEGRFVIPDFQREFEWRPSDICSLMRSIFLDYYIGSLLLWKGKKESFESLSCEAVYGYKGSDKREYIVLDGQQRLTAMFYAFLAPPMPLPNRASQACFYIRVDHFIAEEYDDAFRYDWHTQRWKQILNDRKSQYAQHIFPLSVIGSGGWELYNWMDGYKKFWEERSAAAEAAGDGLAASQAKTIAQDAPAFGEYFKGITDEYQISYIELDKDLEVGKVCDIFTQINSRGIRLDVFDLMNAMLKPKGLQLKHLWREAAPRLEAVVTEKMNVYILQVMSILRQAYCSPNYLYFLLPDQEKPVRDPGGARHKEILIPNVATFEKLWHNAVDALESAIKVLMHPQEYGVVGSAYLPYVSILPVFASLRAHSKTLPPERQLDARGKLRHWYWASVFVNRYSGSVESTSARDFIDIKAWFEDDSNEPAVVREFASRYRHLDLRKEIKRGTSVYNGVFNLLVLQGARDWVTGDVPQYGDLDDHHIVPASWGKEQLNDNRINSILNRTPLSADTNRKVINSKLPNEYLPEWIAKSGEKTVRLVLESHFISPTGLAILLRNPFTPDDYDAFICERERTIQDAIEDLLIKERLSLEPSLRELDSKVEHAELRLRRLVFEHLGADTAQLPQHIALKVNDRISKALKKNSAMDSDRYTTLGGMLEYFDLRDVQDVIVAKPLWPLFESLFGSKEAFAAKVDQLVELRNGIRHSRAVDAVTRKEGEAAILWFEQVVVDLVPDK
jgi:hypothetical protein